MYFISQHAINTSDPSSAFCGMVVREGKLAGSQLLGDGKGGRARILFEGGLGTRWYFDRYLSR